MKIESIRRRTANILALGLVGTIVLSLVLGAGILSQADELFTNKSVEGAYGYSTSGTLFVPSLGGLPGVSVGLITADGNGNCYTTETVNIAPPIDNFTHNSSKCTYNVNPNGTGTALIVFNPPHPGPANLSFVIVNKGSEIPFIRTDPGFVHGGVMKRQ